MKYLLSVLALSFLFFAAPAIAADKLEQQIAVAKEALDKANAESENMIKEYQDSATRLAAEIQALGAKYANVASLPPSEAQELADKQKELGEKSAAEAQAFALRQTQNAARLQELALQYAQLTEKWEAEQAAAAGK